MIAVISVQEVDSSVASEITIELNHFVTVLITRSYLLSSSRQNDFIYFIVVLYPLFSERKGYHWSKANDSAALISVPLVLTLHLQHLLVIHGNIHTQPEILVYTFIPLIKGVPSYRLLHLC